MKVNVSVLLLLLLVGGSCFVEQISAQGAQIKIEGVSEIDPEGVATEQIEKVLTRKISIRLRETSLEDFAKQLSDETKISVVLDHVELDNYGIPGDVPITKDLQNVSLRSALKLILKPLEMTYSINDEVLLLTTYEAAETSLTSMIHDVTDMVTSNLARASQGVGVQVVSQKEARADFDSLVEMITTTIDADMWEAVGGPNTLTVYSANDKNMLVVNATRVTHEKITNLLKQVRAVSGLDAQPKKLADSSETVLKVYPLKVVPNVDSKEYISLIETALPKADWGVDSEAELKLLAGNLIVKHNQEVHSQIASLLRGIGALRESSADSKPPRTQFGGSFGGDGLSGGGLSGGPGSDNAGGEEKISPNKTGGFF